MRRSLILILLLLFIPFPLRAQTPPPQLGFHVVRGDARHMQAVRAAGGNFAVVVFSWANIEPEPNYLYWEEPDAALRAADFYQVDLIARLDQPPDWAAQPGTPTPWNLDAYANFARRVADRYGNRLAGLILWNEPNLSLEWNGQPPDASAYVEMLKATYPVVKATAPDLPVLMGGLASTEGEGDWAINDLDYLQALYAAGGGAYFDILTAHPYGFGRPPDDPPEKYRPNFRRLELYRDIMAAHADAGKPIWVTEMGWLTWTPDPRHDWQVITPDLQAVYTLQAIDYAQAHYPWLERLGIWELNSTGDEYGYTIWQGPNQTSPTYEALVDTCSTRSRDCDDAPRSSQDLPISILAPDVTIRLGDRDTLHPHWVHLYRGGQNASPTWQGEFFLGSEQATRPYELLLETMQVGQATNQLFLNGSEPAYLQTRPRPDPTSTWVTQRFRMPPDLLRPGVNTLSMSMGLRNPARRYGTTRLENMQFRNARLVPPSDPPPAIFTGWQSQPAPSGWSEANRLRAGLAGELWLTGRDPGQLWRGLSSDSPLTLKNQAGARPDLIFNDILPAHQGELVATHLGLFRRGENQPDRWQPVSDAPAVAAYAVLEANGRYYAGFEGEGLWVAPDPAGPWQRAALPGATVIDLVAVPVSPANQQDPVDYLYAVTEQALFINANLTANWQPLPLPEGGEGSGDKLLPRLYPTREGNPVLRYQDRLWRQTQPDAPAWELFGPEHLYGNLFSVAGCCGPGTLLGTNNAGLWQQTAAGTWQQIDGGYFNTTDVTTLLQVNSRWFAAGELGLFQSESGHDWQKVNGLPATVSDLLIDPTTPSRWIAATPAGVYRSQDGGRQWQAISPPWTIWDMAFGPEGRLFLGRTNGLVRTDSLSSTPVEWHPAKGMERVYFLSVNPHPTQANLVWAGTWGNNIAVSEDGGRSVEPLHNGLETLSGLDLIWHPTPGQVTLATIEGLYRTDDHGRSWFLLPGPLSHQTVHSLLQSEDGAIWAGAADGLWVSRDYGTSWIRVESIPAATVIRLGQLTPPAPKTSPRWLWAGTEGAGWWLSRDGGASWQFGGLAEQSVYNVLFDPSQPRRLVAATDQGIFAQP